MDFKLSKEHELLRKMYQEFAQNEVKPLAAELDEEERFPKETIPKLAKLGMLGIPFPKKYGGAGGDNLAYAICVEEIAKTCGTTSVIICAHTSCAVIPFYAYGTEEQKMKYLPDLLSGRKLGALRPDRARRRYRCLRTADHCRAGGRPLCAQRHQVLYYQCYRGGNASWCSP